MARFRAGRYAVRQAETAEDVRRCQRLRHLAFFESRGLAPADGGLDRDAFDPLFRHVMVEDTATGALVCCFRVMPLAEAAAIGRSYSARSYGLERLAGYPAPVVELGRFCVHPAWRDPGIVRAAWGWLIRFIEGNGIELVFGCSSFEGVEAAVYRDAFALLGARHLAPERWRPAVKAPKVVRFAEAGRVEAADLRRGARLIPPLLRSYLLMGGWVSDHAVIDEALGTLHVFIGVEVTRIPEARARLLRRAGAAEPADSPRETEAA